MNSSTMLVLVALVFFLAIALITYLGENVGLNNIKSKTVGDGQHGTARFITNKERKRSYKMIPFAPKQWRKGRDLPTEQGGHRWQHGA